MNSLSLASRMRSSWDSTCCSADDPRPALPAVPEDDTELQIELALYRLAPADRSELEC